MNYKKSLIAILSIFSISLSQAATVTYNSHGTLALGSLSPASDFIPMWDTSASAAKKATINDIVSSGSTALIGVSLQAYDADLTVIGALADPNADRILFWDDSAGAYAYLTAGSGLTITGTTITASGGTRTTSAWDGTSTLSANTDYTYTISGAKTLVFPTGVNGEYISMRFDVSGGPHILTLPASVYRVGTTGTTASITLQTGTHNVKFFYDTRWNMLDSVVDAEAAYSIYGNLASGSNVPGFTSVIDLGGVTSLELKNAAGTATLANGGEVSLNTTDKLLGIHNGTKEVGVSLIYHQTWSFDPKAVCDGAVDRLFLMSTGVSEAKGITIVGWKASFEADPTTEVDLDLKRADAFIGVANSAVMDVLDTTAGVSSESTYTNINGGSVVANGKVIYLEFGTAYTETTHQVIFEMWWEVEED